ncbi:MAG: sulfatase [Nitrospirota bacterium]
MNIYKNLPPEDNQHINVSFCNILRLVFTIFSLYLLGDVFWRWDGFKVHSSFSEYLPNIALALILWSLVALIGSVLLWLPVKIFERFSGYLSIKIKTEHFVLYLSILISLTVIVWAAKKIIWADIQTSPLLKLTVIIFIICTAIPLAWILRNRAGGWLNEVQIRITPLVWIFTVCLILSILLVVIRMWSKNSASAITDGPALSNTSETTAIRPNILFVTYDALTAEDMSVYGYHRDTTPFIKKWAETASSFTRTEAQGNGTATNTASLMTGKRVWTHRRYQFDMAAKPVKAATENLALVMKENGYHTAAFIQNIVASVEAIGISDSVDTKPPVAEFLKPASIEGIIEKYLFLLFGDKFTTYNWLGQDDFIFNELLNKIPQNVFATEYPPALVFDKFFEFIDNNPRGPFFIWLHFYPPHDPQLPPKPFSGTFNPSQELRRKNDQFGIRPEIAPYSSNNLPFPKEVQRKIGILRDYYDEFILYCDKQFENFIAEFQKREWSKNTIIILSSDHGDSFEHNYFLHNKRHLYEQVTHIPLIIKEPAQTEGRIIDSIVEQIDIPATMLDFADIPAPSWMEGRSLRPYLSGDELPAKKAISMNLERNIPSEPITKATIAVWEGEYKLIHYLDDDNSLLFNLSKDPGETINLFNNEPEIGLRLLSFIKSSLKEVNEKIIIEERQKNTKKEF